MFFRHNGRHSAMMMMVVMVMTPTMMMIQALASRPWRRSDEDEAEKDEKARGWY